MFWISRRQLNGSHLVLRRSLPEHSFYNCTESGVCIYVCGWLQVIRSVLERVWRRSIESISSWQSIIVDQYHLWYQVPCIQPKFNAKNMAVLRNRSCENVRIHILTCIPWSLHIHHQMYLHTQCLPNYTGLLHCCKSRNHSYKRNVKWAAAEMDRND